MNECTEYTHNCGNTNAECINTYGSFICRCRDGYRKDDDENCIGKNTTEVQNGVC